MGSFHTQPYCDDCNYTLQKGEYMLSRDKFNQQVQNAVCPKCDKKLI